MFLDQLEYWWGLFFIFAMYSLLAYFWRNLCKNNTNGTWLDSTQCLWCVPDFGTAGKTKFRYGIINGVAITVLTVIPIVEVFVAMKQKDNTTAIVLVLQGVSAALLLAVAIPVVIAGCCLNFAMFDKFGRKRGAKTVG
jgi:hypothetical protein